MNTAAWTANGVENKSFPVTLSYRCGLLSYSRTSTERVSFLTGSHTLPHRSSGSIGRLSR